MTTLSRTQSAQDTSKAMRWLSVYQSSHQVQYLHLQAQLDTLLLELQRAKQQQSPTATCHN
ncbi:MAG: hypothetical protein J7641_11900 [Cyanobacteria bacterium SID2]|nr:hypothetical protein [Cyanobacteria bacterium SID2]MBP0003006.1 hypothetical protein [Cyanobacteria bacterium SBC]